mgnify:CR=1 FL=1
MTSLLSPENVRRWEWLHERQQVWCDFPIHTPIFTWPDEQEDALMLLARQIQAAGLYSPKTYLADICRGLLRLMGSPR